MRPDQHKQAQSRRYQKANPAAAAVAAERRQSTSVRRGKAPAPAPASAAADDDNPRNATNAFRYDGGDGMLGEAAEEGEPGVDLEAMLAEPSVPYFRFSAERAWDPAALVASAGVVGATDRFAGGAGGAPPPRSALWPDMGAMARELGPVPLHLKLGVAPDELLVASADGAESGAAADEGGGAVGHAIDVGAKAVPSSDSKAPGNAVEEEGEEEDLEDWLDSVL